jgi:F0F1-type ATP synthase membrane subunit b/b'
VSPTWVTFLFEAANFLLLAAVLGWFFFRPVRDALERRRAGLEREQQAATEARAEATRALEQARDRRAELEGSLGELRERAERETEAERDRILAAARDQAQREHETLKSELVSLRRAQARAVARDAAFAAREIVERLLERMAGPAFEEALLDAACGELRQLRAAGDLAPVVIESEHPLDERSLAAIAEAAGIATSAAARHVDPELVAGFRVLTARGLVDASARGLAAQAERLLVERLDREDVRDG